MTGRFRVVTLDAMWLREEMCAATGGLVDPAGQAVFPGGRTVATAIKEAAGAISVGSGRFPSARRDWFRRHAMTGVGLERRVAAAGQPGPRFAKGGMNCGSVSHGNRIQVSWETSVTKVSTSAVAAGLA